MATFTKISEVLCLEPMFDEDIAQWKKALRQLGIHMYEDPRFEGSDQCGFILSKEEMTKKEINAFIGELE